MLSCLYLTKLNHHSNLLIETLWALLTCQLSFASHLFFYKFCHCFFSMLVCLVFISRYLEKRIVRGVWGSSWKEELPLFFYKLYRCFFPMLVFCNFEEALWKADYKRTTREPTRGREEKGHVKPCREEAWEKFYWKKKTRKIEGGYQPKWMHTSSLSTIWKRQQNHHQQLIVCLGEV
jgi:hypothetical protein